MPFRMVRGLSFNTNIVSINYNSLVNIPFYLLEGNKFKCKSTPELPIGLSIDSDKQLITGRTKEEDENEYTIICSNNSTITNEWKIKINVNNNYLHGLKTTYMKVQDYDNKCSTIYFPSNSSIINKIVRYEYNISHKYIDEPTIWNGLIDEFSNEFVVNWDGYIKVDIEGNYMFYINSYGAYWIYIDEDLITSKTGCNIINKDEINIYLKEGYYLFKAIYIKNIGGSEFDIHWKKPFDNEYNEISSSLYSTTGNELDYLYSESIYYLDEQILDNYIIYVNSSHTIKFLSIYPELPNGLNFDNTTGRITGIPINCKEISIKQQFNITIIYKDGSNITIDIYITILQRIKPNYINLINIETGNKIENNNFTLGEIYYIKIESEIGYAKNYKVPELPKLWIYDKNLFQLTCIIRDDIEYIDIVTISAIDEVIVNRIYFKIFQTCPKGLNRFLPYFSINDNKKVSDTKFYMYDNNKKIYEYTTHEYNGYKYGNSVCINPKEYQIEVSAFPKDEYHFTFYIDGNIINEYQFLLSYMKNYYNIDINVEHPNFTYPESLIFYERDYGSYLPTVYHYLGYCTIIPDLPHGLSLNHQTGEVFGIVYNITYNNNHTIECKNSVGISQKILH